MQHLEFIKNKYGFELLMDLYRFEDNPHLFFLETPHTTDFYEIMYFEKGHGKVEINGTVANVQNHSIFFFSSGQQKRCFIDKTQVKGYHLVFQDAFLAHFFSDKLFTYRLQYFHNTSHPFFLAVDVGTYQFISTLLHEVLSEIQQYQEDSPHILRSLLYYLLVRLNRAYSTEYKVSHIVEGHYKAYEFKRLLEAHIRQHSKVKTYSEMMQISRVQLNAIVKKQFGISVSEMIAERLLIEIKSALTYTALNISEIALQLNFSEANNLTRFFKTHTGMAPLQYRKLIHLIDIETE